MSAKPANPTADPLADPSDPQRTPPLSTFDPTNPPQSSKNEATNQVSSDSRPDATTFRCGYEFVQEAWADRDSDMDVVYVPSNN